MFLTFIPSNGPICLSKCVWCVLYPFFFFWPDLSPCLISNEARSPRGGSGGETGGELKPHAIYTDGTAGALPAKAVRDGRKEGKISYKLKGYPCVGNVFVFAPRCPLVFLPSVLLPWGATSGQVRSCWAVGLSSAGLPNKHHSSRFTPFCL